MHWVSLFIELLRTRPIAVFWGAALTQAALWTFIPSLLYGAPPGELAEFLAVSREWGLGNPFGPPLAYWLGEIAFRIGGLPAVYLLSQVCVVVAFWAVFSLGRMIVGAPQAAMAVLLMAGIAAFGVPTPEFGTPLLAMALWALILLHYWQAAGQGRRYYWFVVGVEAGLLLLTTYSGFVLIGLLLIFSLVTQRGRAQFASFEPLAAGAVVVLVFFPHLVWMEQTNALNAVQVTGLAGFADNAHTWGRTIGFLLAGHGGLVVLILLARGFALSLRGVGGAEVARLPVDPFARTFVYFFALAPAIAIGVVAWVASRADHFIPPALVLFSGLAVIVAAPDRIRIVHQRLTQFVWAALLLAPPLLVALAIPMLPWFGVDLRVSWPAAEMGRFFGESFERRTGRPLAVVTGDTHTAALVALTAPSRPSVHYLFAPELSPSITRQDIDSKGAVVVWPTATTRGAPPASIQERLPNLVPELPRGFERTVQGRLPLLRIGWSVIRPATAPPASPAAPPAAAPAEAPAAPAR